MQSEKVLGDTKGVSVILKFGQTLDYCNGRGAFKVGQFLNNSTSRLKKIFKSGICLFQNPLRLKVLILMFVFILWMMKCSIAVS